MNLKLINSPDYDIQLKAIQKTGFAIEFVKNPSKEFQLEAINQHFFALYRIHHPDEEVQLLALNKYKINLDNVKNKGKSDSVIETLESAVVVMFLEKITNPKFLLTLYSMTNFQKSKDIIKQSDLWNNNANLILELINEN